MFNNKSLENKPNPCCHKEIKKTDFFKTTSAYRLAGRWASSVVNNFRLKFHFPLIPFSLVNRFTSY